jgi:hypothetical protein
MSRLSIEVPESDRVVIHVAPRMWRQIGAVYAASTAATLFLLGLAWSKNTLGDLDLPVLAGLALVLPLVWLAFATRGEYMVVTPSTILIDDQWRLLEIDRRSAPQPRAADPVLGWRSLLRERRVVFGRNDSRVKFGDGINELEIAEIIQAMRRIPVGACDSPVRRPVPGQLWLAAAAGAICLWAATFAVPHPDSLSAGWNLWHTVDVVVPVFSMALIGWAWRWNKIIKFDQ